MSAIVIMGVSGCGKTTLGKLLAQALDWSFVEGDDLHPAGNVHKMASGQALNDADRLPFLHNVGLALATASSGGVVGSCSALKRQYRDLLRQYCPNLYFILPLVEHESLVNRLQTRNAHFMPVTLLNDQLNTLELPSDDENILCISGSLSPAASIAEICRWLKQQE